MAWGIIRILIFSGAFLVGTYVDTFRTPKGIANRGPIAAQPVQAKTLLFVTCEDKPSNDDIWKASTSGLRPKYSAIAKLDQTHPAFRLSRDKWSCFSKGCPVRGAGQTGIISSF